MIKINRKQLAQGLPTNFSGKILSISPLEESNLMLVTIDFEGADIVAPLTREAVANILLVKGVVSSSPGEVMPEYRPKASGSRKPKVGPKVGTKRVNKGIEKTLVRYDFITPKLKGKRRVVCPDTNKRGFPIWQRT